MTKGFGMINGDPDRRREKATLLELHESAALRLSIAYRVADKAQERADVLRGEAEAEYTQCAAPWTALGRLGAKPVNPARSNRVGAEMHSPGTEGVDADEG